MLVAVVAAVAAVVAFCAFGICTLTLGGGYFVQHV